MHASRAVKVLAVASLVLIAAAGCRRGNNQATETPFETATPTPEPVTFELVGRVIQVFDASDFTNVQDREDFGAQPASPTTSPTATASTDTAPGGVVVRVETLSESLTACGFAAEERAPIVFGSQVQDSISQAQSQGDFPRDLSGQRLGFKGEIDEVGGECVLVANDVQVGTATATPTPRRVIPRATRSPSPSPSPTPTPTLKPTPTPTLKPTPTPTPT
jgi:hypothetical protein